jgi:hypothetical protein
MAPVFAIVVGLAGCYETPRPPCAFLCGANGECPEGYLCSADDNRCHRSDPGGPAECPDSLPFDAAQLDASLIDASLIDASLIDASPFDAAPDPDANNVCATALAPDDDGTSATRQALVLAEIDPGGHLELYNNTLSDIDLDASTVRIVSGADTVALSAAGAGITVLAAGRAEIPWPAALDEATDGSGEVLLYLDATPADDEIMSFVCWGTAPTTSFKSNAEAGDKWTAAGPCPLALVAGAIHRVPSTDGLAAADFDVTTAPSPETCGP